jgi:Ran GTPase-activating protein (RanGAP) involved in mRNA processing and transport
MAEVPTAEIAINADPVDPYATYKHYRSIGYSKSKAEAAISIERSLSTTTSHLISRQQLFQEAPLGIIGENVSSQSYGFVIERKVRVDGIPVPIPHPHLQIKIRSEYNEGPILEHHESRNEMWEQFIIAFRHCGFNDVDKFDMSKVQLTEHLLIGFVATLCLKTVAHLTLKWMDFGYEGYNAMSYLLIKNSSLMHLDLMGNKIPKDERTEWDVIACNNFFNAVAIHPSLETLNLEACGIGSKLAEYICDALASNPSLRHLNLKDNDICDNDTHLFAKALATNTNLRDLILQGNGITDQGIKTLLPCLFNTTSMDAVENSNHTCQIHFGSDKLNHLECISWINRHKNIELTKKEKAAVFREFRRNLPQNAQLQNPGDVRAFSTESIVDHQLVVRRERNAAFRVAGKKAMLFLAALNPDEACTVPEIPKVNERRLTFDQWRSIGHDKKYCLAMIGFEQKLNELIKTIGLINRLRILGCHQECNAILRQKGDMMAPVKGDKSLKLKLNFHMNANEKHQLMHHDKMLQYWRDLSEAIRSCRRFERISVIEISNIQITIDILKHLLPSLTETDEYLYPIRRLVLNSNSLGSSEIVALGPFVRDCYSLEICNSIVNDPKSVKRLSWEICNSRNMKTLKLEKCAIGQNLSALSSLVTSTTNLTYVYLSGNHIGSDGARAISDMLAANPIFEELYLNDNELGDADMTFFAKALQTNSNLRKFYVQHNLITKRGEVTLTKAFCDPENILTIFNSNHTCQAFLKQQDPTIG